MLRFGRTKGDMKELVMAKLKNSIFDATPVPQGTIVNKVNAVIHLLGFFLFITLLVLTVFAELPRFIPKPILIIPLILFSGISLFGFYEERVESERINSIAFEIQSQAPVKKQFIEGIFSNEPVWFSISKRPMSINYAIRVDGSKAVEQKPKLKQYIMNELADAGVRGFKILITEDSVILTKLFIIAFQLVPEKTVSIFSTLVRAKRDILI